MPIAINLVIFLNIISFTLACVSNDECSQISSTKPLFCHPIEQTCTDCIINRDCQSPNSYCNTQGFCMESICCSSNSECRLISPESICQNRVCSVKKDDLISFSQSGSQSRKLAVTTTPASTKVGSIDFKAFRVLTTKDKKTLYAFDSSNKFYVYSLENPAEPKLIVNLILPSNDPRNMILSDDEKFIYIAAYDGLMILDTQNLTIIVNFQQRNLNLRTIEKFKKRPLFAVGLFSDELTILDVTLPQNITVLSTIQLDTTILNSEIIRNDTFLLITTEFSFYVIDITNPATPSIISQDSNINGAFISVLEEENLAFTCSSRCRILNITDLHNVTIIGFFRIYITASATLKIDKHMRLIYIPVAYSGIIILDFSEPSNIKEVGKINTKNPKSFATNLNFTILYIADDTELAVFQTDVFTSSVTNNLLGLVTIATFSNIEPYYSVLSPDESLLYVCTIDSFIVYDVSSIDKIPVLLKKIDFNANGCSYLLFSPDHNYLFLSTDKDGIYVYEMTDPKNPVNISILLPMVSKAQIEVSPDGNLLVSTELFTPAIRFFNITIKHAPIHIRSVDEYNTGIKLFKRNPDVLAVSHNPRFLLWNISNISNITTISYLNLPNPLSIGLTEDENFAFLGNSKYGTRIIDVSNFKNISVVQTLQGGNSWSIYYNPSIKLLYVLDLELSGGIYVYDVSDPLNPNSEGIIPSTDQYAVYVSRQNITYICDAAEGLKVIEMKAKYALKTSTSTSQLGIKTDIKIDVGILRKDKYIPYNSVYKITEISLFKMETDVISGVFKQSFSPLASWMRSDFAKGIVSFSPDDQQHLGKYNIFIKLSTIIDKNSFSSIENITNVHEFYVNNLVGKYLDGEGYLNLNFNPQTELVLEAKYSGFERDIRNILTQSCVQSVVEVEVVKSLMVTSSTTNGYLSIVFDTPTLSSLSIRLTFSNKNVSFMEISYDTSALLRYISSGVVISGSKFDTNISLGLLRVDLSGLTSESDGQMVLNDGLNPILTTYYTNMTRFFRINRSPYENIFIQGQLDSMSILTGNQFNFIMDPLTFIDPEYDILSYNLVTLDGKNLPGWINLVGNTLVGTPPNELGLEVTLKIIASDGYKKAESIFTIKVKPSPAFIFSLIGQYIGPVIGAVGL